MANISKPDGKTQPQTTIGLSETGKVAIGALAAVLFALVVILLIYFIIKYLKEKQANKSRLSR